MIDFSKDYYTVLGVPSSATANDIRRAYIGLALVWHPDRHSGESPDQVAYAEARFKEIGEAYALLSDYDARKQYDYFHSLSSSATASPSPSSRRPAAQPSRPSAGTSSTSGPHPGSAGSSFGASRSSGASSGRDSSFDRGRSWNAGSRTTYTYRDFTQETMRSRRREGIHRFFSGLCAACLFVWILWAPLSRLVESTRDTIEYRIEGYNPSPAFWRLDDSAEVPLFYERMMEMMDFPKVEAREIHLSGSTELLKNNEALTYDITQN